MQRPALLSKVRAGLSFVCILSWMFRNSPGALFSGGYSLLFGAPALGAPALGPLAGGARGGDP